MINNAPGIKLQVTPVSGSAGVELTKFIDYEVDFDLFTVDSAFAINLVPDVDTRFAPGDLVELFISGEKVLTGWIEKVVRGYDKRSRKRAIYGRSTSSILVDNAIRPDDDMWAVHENVKLTDMVKKLLGQLDASHRPELDTSVIISEGADLKVEISPGESYWEVLTRIATARGLYIVCLAAGKLQLRTMDNMADARQYRIVSRANLISSEVTYDENRRYANIIVISQDATSTDSAVIFDADATFPRTVVINPEQDGQSLEGYGNLHKARQVKDSVVYEYTVSGHDQNGLVWGVGGAAYVQDYVLGIDRALLITGVRFTLSKEDGQQTVLRLAPLEV